MFAVSSSSPDALLFVRVSCNSYIEFHNHHIQGRSSILFQHSLVQCFLLYDFFFFHLFLPCVSYHNFQHIPLPPLYDCNNTLSSFHYIFLCSLIISPHIFPTFITSFVFTLFHFLKTFSTLDFSILHYLLQIGNNSLSVFPIPFPQIIT